MGLLGAVGEGVKRGTLKGRCVQPKVVVTEGASCAGAFRAVAWTFMTGRFIPEEPLAAEGTALSIGDNLLTRLVCLRDVDASAVPQHMRCAACQTDHRVETGGAV